MRIPLLRTIKTEKALISQSLLLIIPKIVNGHMVPPYLTLPRKNNSWSKLCIRS